MKSNAFIALLTFALLFLVVFVFSRKHDEDDDTTDMFLSPSNEKALLFCLVVGVAGLILYERKV